MTNKEDTVITDLATDLITEIHILMKNAYLYGFNASREGYNAEYPFSDNNWKPECQSDWIEKRDNVITQILKTGSGEIQ